MVWDGLKLLFDCVNIYIGGFEAAVTASIVITS